MNILFASFVSPTNSPIFLYSLIVYKKIHVLKNRKEATIYCI